jgi:hypothetical protein
MLGGLRGGARFCWTAGCCAWCGIRRFIGRGDLLELTPAGLRITHQVRMSGEVGHTPRGDRVTLERESRVEGGGPHVFVYDKQGRRYRVGVPTGKTAEQVANELVSGKESDLWITE